MKEAIITGATGFMGSRLARMLLGNNYKVIALGRKDWKEVDKLRLKEHKNLSYIKVDMKDILSLPSLLKEAKIKLDNDCVFYHFAWGGKDGLSNLKPQEQYLNVGWALNSLKIASELKIRRYIYFQTMETAFAKAYLPLDFHTSDAFNRHVVYALAKKCAQDFLKAAAHLYDIDLIIATSSHITGANDYRDTFLKVTLQKLIDKKAIEMTSGEQTFDSVSSSDCARALINIALKGKQKSEYWIGSGSARKLKEYVEIMAKLFPSGEKIEFGKIKYSDVKLEKSVFSPEKLELDTGFKCKESFEESVKNLYEWLKFGKIIEDNEL